MQTAASKTPSSAVANTTRKPAAATAASGTNTCRVCRESITGGSFKRVGKDKYYHSRCFLCCECLQPFPDEQFFTAPPEEGEKLLCESDYHLLFADRCAQCGEIITDSCVSAMDMKWHPEHFTCEECGKVLTDGTFVYRKDRLYCKPCTIKVQMSETDQIKNSCARCGKLMDIDETYLQIKEHRYHVYHFNCVSCKRPLERDFKELDGKYYCADDYAKVRALVCFACGKPITGRSVAALSRAFHPEHFACCICEQPFDSGRFWEHQGKAYCELHYNEQCGNRCNYCFQFTTNKIVTALNQTWCQDHFRCFGCDKQFVESKEKFVDWDSKPFCVRCFEQLSFEVRKRLNDYADHEAKLAKNKIF